MQETQTSPKVESTGSAKVEFTLTMDVSDLARAKLQEFLGDKSLAEVGVRISVQPGGCSGASYGMDFSETRDDGEMELLANGVRLFVAPEYAPLLNGVHIEYLDELMGGGFKIHNPNAKSSCGCGKSFSA